jgi:hypothetical protein
MKKSIVLILLLCGIFWGLLAQDFVTIIPGTVHDAEILNPGDRHYYNVTLRGTESLLVAFTTSNIDTVMNLLDVSGTVIAHDDDSGENYNAMIRTFVPGGTYTIEIWGFGSHVGLYSLHVQETPINFSSSVDRRFLGRWVDMSGATWEFNSNGRGSFNEQSIKYTVFSDRLVIHFDNHHDYYGSQTEVNSFYFSPDSNTLIIFNQHSTRWLIKIN